MKSDHLTFRTATNVSLLGLAIQAVIGLVLLGYALADKDHAAFSGALLVLVGAGVWLCLAVVFDQHRRERLEALEAESIAAQHALSSTAFEETARDLRPAARRLALMHKALLPVASLLLAAALVTIGILRLRSVQARELLDPDSFVVPQQRGWAISIGLVVAVLGFAFARYVSGMAKQPVWTNLRAGAAQAVGAALVGLLLALAQFIDIIGPDVVLRYLTAVIPLAMLALGGEIVLNFLLNIYRPRRAGEVPRPAFESRVLGFVAAPDRIAESIGEAINYQFGFNVTASWFYRLLSRWIAALVAVGALVIWGMTFMAVVGPDEQGLRLRNGALVETVGPGFYTKLPWPLERIERFKATAARRMNLAAPPPVGDRAVLWTNEHGVDEKEYYLLVRPSVAEETQPGGVGPAGAGRAARDFVLVTVEVPLYYSVRDAAAFAKFAAEDAREELIRAVARRALFSYLATVRVDSLLGAGRHSVSDEVRVRVQAALDALDPSPGIDVLYVGIVGAHPPTETAVLFEKVVESEQTRRSAVEQARSDRITTLTRAAGSVPAAERAVALIGEYERLSTSGAPAEELARTEQELLALLARTDGGSASVALRQAKTERWGAHMRERARAEQYAGQLAAFRAMPELFMADMYLATIRDVMGRARVYLVADDAPVEVRGDLTDSDTGANPLLTPSATEEQ
ncbi:MAG TPA: SPFH domain-containing protein [Phycisphaerales bacterium]|nr:SPFH domain-containing protein [Phycisphaerales bacterium]